MSVLIIDGLHRDVFKNRSFVTVTWKGEPEKSLGLPVPFDCQLDDLKAETEKAVKALAEGYIYPERGRNAGEAIHTEDSHKYTVRQFRQLATEAGFEPRAVWVDPDALFSVHWLEAP